MAHGLCEMLLIRNVLKELKFMLPRPMELYCDNASAIQLAHNPVQHDRTKHVEVNRHFIKKNLDREIIASLSCLHKSNWLMFLLKEYLRNCLTTPYTSWHDIHLCTNLRRSIEWLYTLLEKQD